MRRLAWAWVVMVTGCAATPLEQFLARARQNEVAAVWEATDARLTLAGEVRELSFERSSSVALVTTSVAQPLPTGPGLQTTTRTREQVSGFETPYADLTSEGVTVRCYFERASETGSLAVGTRARLRGSFRALRHLDDGGLRLWLEACQVEATELGRR